jgi:ribonuclease R
MPRGGRSMNLSDLSPVLKPSSRPKMAASSDPQGPLRVSAPQQALRPSPAATADRKRGRVNANPKGFGFVTAPEGEEFFVSPSDMRKLVPGDEVEFRAVAGKKPDSFQAQVLGVVSRPDTVWQGELVAVGSEMVLRPDGDAPCFCTLAVANMTFSAPGQVVSVRVRGFTASVSGETKRPAYRTEARVERILGERTRPGFILDFAMARYDFPVAFTSDAVAQGEAAAAAELDWTGRGDLRELALVTIDGESTRDYDDAVHGIKTPEGWTLTVAIADVAHFVSPGSALDREAFARSTSVYLPGLVSPMLPEGLSNGACSLIPDTDRLAVVLTLKLDAAGELIDATVARAVVRSTQRLTYSEVQAWSEGTFAVKEVAQPSLMALWEIFKLCDARRAAAGRLDFDAPEPKVSIQADGAIDLKWVYRTNAHRLVEELMLLANRSVAKILREKASAFFRHQPPPEGERWEVVREFALGRGAEVNLAPSMRGLAALVQSMEGDDVLKAELTARGAMQPALYSSEEPLHFSLSFSAYTHFTSPIRRYADLVVHRLLLGSVVVSPAELAAMAAQCSNRSRAGRMAERLVWDTLKKSSLWRSHLAEKEPLACHVVAQSRRGLRAVAPRWQAAVFVEASHLQGQGYRFDPEAECWSSVDKVFDLGSTLALLPTALVVDGSKQEVLAALAAPAQQ